MFLSGLKYLRRLERQVKFAKKPVLQNKTGGCLELSYIFFSLSKTISDSDKNIYEHFYIK